MSKIKVVFEVKRGQVLWKTLQSRGNLATSSGKDRISAMVFRLAPALTLLAASLAASSSQLEDAVKLQQQGKFKEAREVLRAAASDFGASADRKNQARALSMAGKVSLALGDYSAAISDAEKAVAIRQALIDGIGIGEDLNTEGSANLYLGNYAAALSNFREALKLAEVHGDAEAAITRQNNIGNTWYFQGRYSDALNAYQAALEKVNATTGQNWNPRRRQITITNLATLYQRVGKEQMALELYHQLAGSAEALPPSEQAQLLLNQGILYRRLGDPLKALDLYREAQLMFDKQHHPDGEISALRSVGIVRAADLNDLSGGVQAFTAGLELAERSSNLRGIAQSKLYRAQVFHRLHRLSEAEDDTRAAFEAAGQAGLVEERWQAQYELGKLAEEQGRIEIARDAYRVAIDIIESLRSGLTVTLRNEFLADKRDVYDSMIALQLHDPEVRVAELFSWIERSRTRTLVERLRSAQSRQPTLSQIQSALATDTVFVDFWVGAGSSAALWITRSSAGVVRHPESWTESLARLQAALQTSGDGWKDMSRFVGKQLLAGVPLQRHLIVVPDGPLDAFPLEVLIEPTSERLLVEKHDISYLPAALFLPLGRAVGRNWLPPWRTQLVAFGDPPVASDDAFTDTERWQRLSASADEVAGIAGLLPGRAQVHLGPDARKRYLMDHGVRGVPLIHFSTHAVVDDQNPDRSRMLFAPESPAMQAGYLFEAEVYDLDLSGVDLATISACDTARGKLVPGEGVEAFSRAFLAAGSAATITSVWRVSDQPTSDFMKLFYYYLARGHSKAEALQAAKVQFLKSNTPLAHPRYWAAFVLNGDGWNATRRIVSWSVLALAVLTLLALGSAGFLWWNRRGQRMTTVAPEQR